MQLGQLHLATVVLAVLNHHRKDQTLVNYRFG